MNKEVVFCWIPSHIEIPGIERVDRLAVAAAMRREEYILVYYWAWYPVIKDVIMEEWNKIWREAKQRLYQVKKNVGQWQQIKNLTRREEVVMNRLRAGYSRLTHGYLMENVAPQVPLVCRFCNIAVIAIKHLLFACPNLAVERRNVTAFRAGGNVTEERVLGDKVPIKELVTMLRNIGVYDNIQGGYGIRR